jgi:dinuclear metal center YbgI/SA1388 family protein
MAKHPTRDEVLDVLREIAPLELAAEWDNVGLLVAPRASGPVARVLLTIDLTEAVANEAVAMKADLVVAYHPPIFHGIKKLDVADAQKRGALLAFSHGVSVYSPHTALDAAPGGIADWLCNGIAGGAAPEQVEVCGDGEFGRVLTLSKAMTVDALLPRIRKMLGVKSLRVAHTKARGKHKVKRIAVAAGSGGSVLRAARADLWLTGELSHHEALAAVANGACVVLGEHSNTERGYLRELKKRMSEPFGKALDVRIAKSDADPFSIA